MSLSENLSRMVGELEGSRGVALVGMDGIIVEEKKRESDLDFQMLGAEFSGLLKSTMTLVGSIDFGGMTELIASAERSLVLLRPVTIDYFLILVIHPDGNLGKARFLLRRYGSLLKTEL